MRSATVRFLSQCHRAERSSGERTHQPDFLTPYLEAILGSIGLHDLTFFSVEGSALGPDALVEARTKTDQEMQRFFLRFMRNSTALFQRAV